MKFYEKEKRKLKLEKNQQYIGEILVCCEELIKELWFAYGLKFQVFDINTEVSPNSITAILVPCCGNDIDEYEHLRKKITDKLCKETRFKKIIWEA